MFLHNVTFDCADPYGMAVFWSEVTGWRVSGEDEPGGDEALVESPGRGPGLLFLRVPEGKGVKNRVHLDWSPTERTRDEEVERVIGLGARVIADHRTADGLGWVVLADPEGNEFCIERSRFERPDVGRERATGGDADRTGSL